MPKQKTEDLFTIAPLPAMPEPPSRDSLSFAKRELTPRHKRAAAELDIQQFVMDGHRQKVRLGQGYIQELDIHAVELFVEGADLMWALRAGKRDSVPQQLIDQFTVRQIQRNGIYLEQAADAGGQGILEEMHRSFYPHPKLKRPGFFARLAGADDEY
jgi:hypothetical protein